MHCSPSRRATRPPTGAVCPVKGPQLRVPPTLSGRLPLGSWGSGKLPHAINTSAQHRHCSVQLAVKLSAVVDVDVGLTCGRKRQGGGKRHPPSGSREAVLPPLPFLTLSSTGVSRQVRVEGIEARESGARPVGRSCGAARCMRELVWAAQVQLCSRESVARQVFGVSRQVRIAARKPTV